MVSTYLCTPLGIEHPTLGSSDFHTMPLMPTARLELRFQAGGWRAFT